MIYNANISPNAQSAEVTINVNGDFNYYQPLTPPKIKSEQRIIIRLYEQGYVPDTNMQKMTYICYMRTDGTIETDCTIKFLMYPLRESTSYYFNITTDFVNNNNQRVTEISHNFNFATFKSDTAGIQDDRSNELSLQDKKWNATLLYNTLVKRQKLYTPESFCCMLGLADCAGDINPTKYLVYKMGEYNGNDLDSYMGDTVAYIGHYNRYIDSGTLYEDLYVEQNGFIKCSPILYGDYTYDPYNREYILSICDYFSYNFTYASPNGWLTNYEPPSDIFKAWFFGCIPIQHTYGTIQNLLTNGTAPNLDSLYDFINSNSWLKIETLINAYKFMQNRGTTWNLTAEHRQQYSELWNRFNTYQKFSKCTIPNIEKIAEFMCYCFIDTKGVIGLAGFDQIVRWEVPPPEYARDRVKLLDKLFNVECVKKKARYWYNYFKKRRHPWWIYIKWNI